MNGTIPFTNSLARMHGHHEVINGLQDFFWASVTEFITLPISATRLYSSNREVFDNSFRTEMTFFFQKLMECPDVLYNL
jgi:hypothetical protein